jgi:hypothetical protein
MGNLPAGDVPMENRKVPRQRTYKGGFVSSLAGGGLSCLIRNLTTIGACLELESPVGIPDEFVLVIRPENQKRTCRVVWRKGQRIGVRFV